ncbi:putative geranylgeranyl pyrophosphate synthase [Nocardia nova SH22a]|uniref:Putative geranylgeranyl pyrophosphate synthase n=1 Tax=Nocardia nova SH22a TaxID=1415166 RepID=W5TLX0_9NOCA|nr:polyprenyl synthetase family protein [Nocardia nova]AHH20340.1 putative geranylgeranyl pyrophosphate synthase [Nocardia nova SH22a]
MTVTTLSTVDADGDAVRSALFDAVERLDDSIRPVVAYHLGWCDEHGRPVTADSGKSVRSRLTMLAAHAAGGDESRAVPGAVAVELVHNFSLVHDDLMDRDATRRHRPTVWAVWGDAVAVLAGDAMLSLAHEVLLESGSPQAVAAALLVGRATQDLIRGQAADVDFESRNDVGLAECIRMADGKTAALLSASAAIGGILAEAPPATVAALRTYGSEIGLAFQLVDDLLGIWGDPAVTGKPVFSDLRSRKKSLPVTWSLESGRPAGGALAQWLAQTGEPTESELRAAADMVETAGGRRWARSEARRRVRTAQRALDGAALDPSYRQDMHRLADFIVERSA